MLTSQKAIFLLENKRKPFEECPSPVELSSDSESDADSAKSAVQVTDLSRLEYLTRILRIEDSNAGHTNAGDDPAKLHEDDSNIGELENLPPPETEMVQIYQSVQDVVQQLYKLALVIRRPVPRNTLDKSSSIDMSHYVSFDKEHVEECFPCARPELQGRLAKATTRRRQLLLYRERHHQALAQIIRDQEQNSTDLQEDNVTVAPSQRWDDNTSQQQSRIDDGDYQDDRKEPESSSIHPQSTKATTFVHPEVQDVRKQEDQESVAGTESSYAPILSGENTIALPPCPEDCNQDTPAIFECPICFYVTEIHSTRHWK